MPVVSIANSLDYLPDLLQGLLWTLGISAAVMVLSLIGALFVALARLSPWKPVRGMALSYVEIIRCTPALVQLYYIFYVLPLFGLALPALVAGVVAFTLIYSAFISEVYRAALMAVPPTQMEAARALGMNYWQAMFKVILPQAARTATPPTVNYLLSLIKDTSLLSVITIQELMFSGLILASRTFEYFTILTLVAIIYFVVCFPLTILARRLERRFDNELGYVNTGSVGLSGPGLLKRAWGAVK